MNSLDTNILIYAANSSAPEHGRALAVVQAMLGHPGEWILADQVLWEFYRALRHPRILQKPRSAAQAAAHLRFLREESGIACCAYELPHFAEVLECLGRSRFPYQRTHDALLGITLRRHGVTTFYTRNERDFTDVGLPTIVNPID